MVLLQTTFTEGGMVLRLNEEHYFTISMGGGKRSNTKDELLSLWGLLQFTALIGISDISIFWDPKVIIEWINGNYTLQVLELKQWCQKIQLLKISFIHTSSRYISRSFIMMVDSLSKKAIILKASSLQYQKFSEGLLLNEG